MSKKVVKGFIVLGFSLLFVSCASKPKRPMVINTVSTSANTNLENAKSCIVSGNYEKADFFLETAVKMALSVDNNELLTTIYLTKVSSLLSQNPVNVEEAKIALEKARNYAQSTNNIPKYSALCELYEIRIQLTEETPDYKKLLNSLDSDFGFFEKDLYEKAQIVSIKADIYRLQKDYDSAVQNYNEAIQIFTKECYLSELGLSWYKLAQTYSLNNDKAAALNALSQAIKYDRDAENSNALGTDYYVKAIILLKGNPTNEEKELAKKALIHSVDIFTACELSDLANKSQEKLDTL